MVTLSAAAGEMDMLLNVAQAAVQTQLHAQRAAVHERSAALPMMAALTMPGEEPRSTR